VKFHTEKAIIVNTHTKSHLISTGWECGTPKLKFLCNFRIYTMGHKTCHFILDHNPAFLDGFQHFMLQ